MSVGGKGIYLGQSQQQITFVFCQCIMGVFNVLSVCNVGKYTKFSYLTCFRDPNILYSIVALLVEDAFEFMSVVQYVSSLHLMPKMCKVYCIRSVH